MKIGFYGILVLVGFMGSFVVVIQNIASQSKGQFFLDATYSVGSIAIFCIIFGIMMGFGIKGMIEEKNNEYDDNF